jgi:hypothetical protein
MRTLVLVIALALFGAGTASAAPRHAKKQHHPVKHAKLKRHSSVKRA